jgi:hypothetical protein
MKKTIVTIVILTTILTSCGPSAEQVAAEEKRKLDSATIAGQQQLLDQQATAQAEAEAAAQQEILKQQLIDLSAQLAGEESKLNSIGEFKLLRTVDEKAAQIAEQTKVVMELKAQIAEVEQQIVK